VICDDPELGHRIAGGLEALGWRTELHMLLAWDGEDPPAVAELAWPPGADLRDAYRASQAEAGTAAAALGQIVEHAATMPTAPGIRLRRAAILRDGTPAAMLKLFDDGTTAELDDVTTLARFRGHGLGTELMHGAIAAARQSGCDLVFLRADEGDWPASWYQRLGFRPLGRQYVFSLT
jgi:GNAT superfamily N-acetyltransferase